MDDEFFMQQALLEAEAAYAKGEVPVGAVLVYAGKIIARAHNLVESRSDASAHAELLCLQGAANALGNWRLLGATLYCTLEPCLLCAGAMHLFRIEALITAAPDLRQGVHGSWIDLKQHTHPIHQFAIRTGVLASEAAALMQRFFREKRCQNLSLKS